MDPNHLKKSDYDLYEISAGDLFEGVSDCTIARAILNLHLLYTPYCRVLTDLQAENQMQPKFEQ